MKTNKPPTPVMTDPWQALAHEGALQAVPLEGVLARLHCTGREAGAVRHDLLDEVNRLADAGTMHGTTKGAASATKPAFAG